MRTSYNSGRRRGPRVPPAAAAGLVALALVLVVAGLWREQTSAALWRILAPVFAAKNAFGQDKVAVLQAELASSSAALADRNLLYQENLDLKARLGRDASVHPMLAAIIARPPAAAYDSFMLDVGANGGIAVGDRVSAGGTTAIGTITALYGTTARATLYSAPGSEYAALLMHGAQSVPVTIVGQGGGSFSAQVPAGTAVAVGDAVIFPGVADAFAGQVAAVKTQAGESFSTLYLHLPVDLFALRFVEVFK